MLFPQRASEISRCLGLLPEDLTCDIALRSPSGDPKAFDADPQLHVSLPALRKASLWYVTHNFEWMLATQDDGNPEQNYLGAHLERLLREYAWFRKINNKFSGHCLMDIGEFGDLAPFCVPLGGSREDFKWQLQTLGFS